MLPKKPKKREPWMVNVLAAICHGKHIPDEDMNTIDIMLTKMKEMRDKWINRRDDQKEMSEENLGKRLSMVEDFDDYISESDNTNKSSMKNTKNIKLRSKPKQQTLRQTSLPPPRAPSPTEKRRSRGPKKTRTKDQDAEMPPNKKKWNIISSDYLDRPPDFDATSVMRRVNESNYGLAKEESMKPRKDDGEYAYYTKTYEFSDLEFNLTWRKLPEMRSVVPEVVSATDIRTVRLNTISSTMFQRMKKVKPGKPENPENPDDVIQRSANELLRNIRAIRAIETFDKEVRPAIKFWNDLDHPGLSAVPNQIVWRRLNHSSKPDGVGFDQKSGRMFPVEVKTTSGYVSIQIFSTDSPEEVKEKTETNQKNEKLDEDRLKKLMYEALYQTYHAMLTLNSSVGVIIFVKGPKDSRSFTHKTVLRPSDFYNDKLVLESSKKYFKLLEHGAKLLSQEGANGFLAVAEPDRSEKRGAHYQNDAIIPDPASVQRDLLESLDTYQIKNILELVAKRGKCLYEHMMDRQNAGYSKSMNLHNKHQDEVDKINADIIEVIVDSQNPTKKTLNNESLSVLQENAKKSGKKAPAKEEKKKPSKSIQPQKTSIK